MIGYIIASLSKPEEEHGEGAFVSVREVQSDEEMLKETLIKSWIGRMRDAKIARKLIVKENAIGTREARAVWEKAGFVQVEGEGLVCIGM